MPRKKQNPMGSIYNQTLGIIGCGAIGRWLPGKAKVFGLNIIGYDPTSCTRGWPKKRHPTGEF